jgi:hypothetical protein
MKSISDEMIMAYVDGELTPEQATAVELALKNDPMLRKTVVLFSDTTAMLDGVYDAPLHENVPESLLKVLNSAPLESRWTRGIKLCLRAIQVPAMHPVPTFALLAITIISSSLLYSNGFLNQHTQNSYPSFVFDNAFSRGLENTPSGQSFADQHSSVEILPILSFQNQQKYYCRQFEIVDKTQNNHFRGSGIACRDNNKKWETIAYSRATPMPTAQSDKISYELAGASNQLDTLIDERRNGEILTISQEHTLIQQGWKTSSE